MFVVDLPATTYKRSRPPGRSPPAVSDHYAIVRCRRKIGPVSGLLINGAADADLLLDRDLLDLDGVAGLVAAVGGNGTDPRPRPSRR